MEAGPRESVPIAGFDSRAGCAKRAGAFEQPRPQLRSTTRAVCLPRFLSSHTLVVFADPGGSRRPGSIPGRVAALACSLSACARRCAQSPRRSRARWRLARTPAALLLPLPVARVRETLRARAAWSRPAPSSPLNARARSSRRRTRASSAPTRACAPPARECAAARSLPPPAARARETRRARAACSSQPRSYSPTARARRSRRRARRLCLQRARALPLTRASPLACTCRPLVACERRDLALRRLPAWWGFPGMRSDALCACATEFGQGPDRKERGDSRHRELII